MWVVIKTRPEPESLWVRVIKEEPIFSGAVGPFLSRASAEKYARAKEEQDEKYLYDVAKVNTIEEEENE